MPCVLIGEGVVEELDAPSFFGTDDYQWFPEVTRFPELLTDLGFFKSRSDARRNGWNKEIPEGYSRTVIGKLKREVYILKVTRNNTHWIEPADYRRVVEAELRERNYLASFPCYTVDLDKLIESLWSHRGGRQTEVAV